MSASMTAVTANDCVRPADEGDVFSVRWLQLHVVGWGCSENTLLWLLKEEVEQNELVIKNDVSERS